MNKNILIVAAHPDDEVLGCGGAILLYKKKGFNIHVAFMTDGENSRQSNQNQVTPHDIANRRESAKKCLKILGVDSYSFNNFPDNEMDSVSILEVTKYVEKLIHEHKPSMIFTHHIGDVNIDHQICHRAVLTASRPQNSCPVKTILSFEIPSSTEWQFVSSNQSFSPNIFLDISEFFEKKIEALKCYSKELRDSPHPRSIEGVSNLAMYRGSTIGVNHAESFLLARHIS